MKIVCKRRESVVKECGIIKINHLRKIEIDFTLILAGNEVVYILF